MDELADSSDGLMLTQAARGYDAAADRAVFRVRSRADGKPSRVFAVGRCLRVGRDPGNDLVLRDPKVSGVHAEIELVEGGMQVTDLDSKNGVWSGDQRITSAFVPTGHEIRFGDHLLAAESVEASTTSAGPPEPAAFGAFDAGDGPLARTRALVERLAETSLPFVLTGGTGVGKELFALEVHRSSARAKAPFLGVHCGMRPDTRLELELFGDLVASMEGMAKARHGLLTRAGGGTLLIEAIDQLPMPLQARLLHVLGPLDASGLEPRVGQDAARIIATTDRHLGKLVQAGAFHPGLYARLEPRTVEVPGLRDRSR
ncbi:MAG: sigma 54-interacting transcriptional regulator [Myxococcota bacterium]